MNLERAFLDDVIERPDDDAPRLVYADWLEDHGDPDRAEFIRAQCRLATMAADDPARLELQKREKELLDANAVRWAEPLRGMVSVWSYRRGFIDFVRLDRNHDIRIEVLTRLFRLAPLEGLALEDFGEDTAPALLSLNDKLPRLCYLYLVGMDGVAAQDLRALLTSPGMRNLRTLLLDQPSTHNFPVDALDVLGWSPALSALTELGVAVGESPGELPAGVVRSLARSPYLRPGSLLLAWAALARPLRCKDLAGETFQRLESLSLDSTFVEHRFWPELLRPGSFPRLRSLRLHNVAMTDITLEALRGRFGPGTVTLEALDDEDFFPRREGHHWPSP